MSTSSTIAQTLCTSCNTVFSGSICPTCGKTVDSIYAEGETKEKFKQVVNQRFKTNFSLPSELYIIPVKTAPTRELAFVRGLIGEQNKIFALRFGMDTGVRLNNSNGFKCCFAYFIADKKEQFESEIDAGLCIEQLDEQVSATALSVNLFECVDLKQLESLRGSICAEQLLCSLSFALLKIFVTLAEKNYQFVVPEDDELYVEFKDNRIVSVKYVVLNNPRKMVGDVDQAHSKNISSFCSYLERLFQRFCDIDQKAEQGVPNSGTQDGLGKLNKAPVCKFEYSWTLYKLLMLANAGKNSSNQEQKISTLESFKQYAKHCLGVDFEHFFKGNTQDKHFASTIFDNTTNFALASVSQLSDKNFDDLCVFFDNDNNIAISAVFEGLTKTKETCDFTSDLANFCNEYIHSKLYGGLTLTSKSKRLTPFFEKLKGKLKKSNLDFIQNNFVAELVQKLSEKADQLNENSIQQLQASLALAFMFRQDNNLHILTASVGSSKIYTVCDDKVQNATVSDSWLGSEAKLTVESHTLKKGDSLAILASGAHLKPSEICTIQQVGSSKCSLYNILSTALLQGATGTNTAFVLKFNK